MLSRCDFPAITGMNPYRNQAINDFDIIPGLDLVENALYYFDRNR